MDILSIDKERSMMNVNVTHNYLRKVSSVMFEIGEVYNLSDDKVKELTGFNKKQIDDVAWRIRDIMDEYEIDL